jgi:hypothetical protein
MNAVALKDLIALQDLLNYCQSVGRFYLEPYAWEEMFHRFIRRNKNYDYSNNFPPTQPILGGWTNDKEYKKLLFLTHIYWIYKNGNFKLVDRHIRSCDDDKWNIDRYYQENEWGIERQFNYVRLDEVKEEYNDSWPTKNPGY